MDKISAERASSVLMGAAALALTLGVMENQPAKASKVSAEQMRDAVASPILPAAFGGGRVSPANLGYFASPAGNRAEAERALLSSRKTKLKTGLSAVLPRGKTADKSRSAARGSAK